MRFGGWGGSGVHNPDPLRAQVWPVDPFWSLTVMSLLCLAHITWLYSFVETCLKSAFFATVHRVFFAQLMLYHSTNLISITFFAENWTTAGNPYHRRGYEGRLLRLIGVQLLRVVFLYHSNVLNTVDGDEKKNLQFPFETKFPWFFSPFYSSY